MIITKIASGTVHKLPKDLLSALTTSVKTRSTWESLTPLARNEWICWVESAKQIDTRERRIGRVVGDLSAGKRRPCCWAGCIHRTKNGH